MLTLNQIECGALALYKLSWRPDYKWCDLAPRRIHYRLACLCNCYDRCFNTSASPSLCVIVWWRRGEDYDEFEGIRASTCISFKSKLTMIFLFFMISQWGIWVLMISQCYLVWGLGILYCCRMRKTLDSELVCNPSGKEVPALVWGECLTVLFDSTVDGLAMLNGWLWRSGCTLGTCVWVKVHLVHNHTQQPNKVDQ